EHLEQVVTVMKSVGAVVVVTETQMDAVTAVSGSGPAYFFLLAEAMIDAAVEQGLPRQVATELAVGPAYGAGALLAVGRGGPAGRGQLARGHHRGGDQAPRGRWVPLGGRGRGGGGGVEVGAVGGCVDTGRRRGRRVRRRGGRG